MTPRILATLALVALVAILAGCATTRPPGPTVAQLHAELERCKAESRLGWNTDVNLCFAKARRAVMP